MDSTPVLQFLQQHFQEENIFKIDFYKGCTYNVWEPLSDITIRAVFTPENNILEKAKINGNMHSSNKGNVDLEHVVVHDIAIRQYRNGCDNPIPFYLNFNEIDEDRIHNKMLNIWGIKPTLDPTKNELTPCKIFPLLTQSFKYNNKGFILSTCLLTETNIKNGIVWLPRPVVQKANIKLHEKDDTFVLVPPDHILAWTLHIPHEERLKKGITAYELTVRVPDEKDSKLICFIVHSKSFLGIFEDCKQYFLNKTDKRPLKKVGFNFELPRNFDKKSNILETRAILSYFAFPEDLTMKDATLFKPTLHKSMPPYYMFINPDNNNNNIDPKYIK